MPPALAEGSAFVPWIGGKLDDFLCETFERVVGKDNCVAFGGMALQIPKDRHQMHYMKVKVWGALLSRWQPCRVPQTALLGSI